MMMDPHRKRSLAPDPAGDAKDACHFSLLLQARSCNMLGKLHRRKKLTCFAAFSFKAASLADALLAMMSLRLMQGLGK